MAHRVNYWSCTRFADWVRGTPKPGAETGKGWHDWKMEAKANHPIRYWIAEEGLDLVQDIIHWPTDRLYNIKYWFANRFVTRTHALTSNLKPGQWYDLDTRIMHCLFDELINFVEVEKAWMNIAWDEKARKEFKAPFWAVGWFRSRCWRSAEAGIAHLKWEISLTCDESMGFNKNDPDYGKPTSQARDAQEILDLYRWWKHERPLRPDPMDASGWSALCEERRTEDDPWFLGEDKTPSQKRKTNKALDLCHKLEVKYENEDTDMLIRLIKLRRHLWT